MINKIKSRKPLNELLLQKLFAKAKVLSLFKNSKANSTLYRQFGTLSSLSTTFV